MKTFLYLLCFFNFLLSDAYCSEANIECNSYLGINFIEEDKLFNIGASVNYLHSLDSLLINLNFKFLKAVSDSGSVFIFLRDNKNILTEDDIRGEELFLSIGLYRSDLFFKKQRHENFLKICSGVFIRNNISCYRPKEDIYMDEIKICKFGAGLSSKVDLSFRNHSIVYNVSVGCYGLASKEMYLSVFNSSTKVHEGHVFLKFSGEVTEIFDNSLYIVNYIKNKYAVVFGVSLAMSSNSMYLRSKFTTLSPTPSTPGIFSKYKSLADEYFKEVYSEKHKNTHLGIEIGFMVFY